MDNPIALTCLQLLEHAFAELERSGEPEAALSAALRLVCEATEWPLAHAWLPSPDHRELCAADGWYATNDTQRGRVADFLKTLATCRIRADAGFVGRVFASGEPAWTGDLDPLDPGLAPSRSSGCAACFACPIRSGGRTLGVLVFHAHDRGAPPPRLRNAIVQVGLHLGCVFERHAARVASHALAAGERDTHEILDCAADAFIAMDHEHRITDWNRAAGALFGWTRDEAIGRTVTDTIIPERYRARHREGVRHLLASGEPRVLGKPLELAGLHRDGHESPIELTLWSIRRGDGWRFYAFARDVNQRNKLRQRAYYDVLTGLPNRALAMEQLTHLLARRGPDDTGLAVLFVDLDHFKRINDSVGHEAGDQTLVAAAGRFRNAVRPGDMVSRLAGDEFLVICPGIRTYQEASFVAERILAALTDPVHIKDDSVFLTASIGVALPGAGATAEGVIASADMAMYRAKNAGRAGFELFDDKMRQVATSRLRIENELREALARKQLRLYFQPIVDIAEGTIAAVEALMRWEHPTRGLLQPADFIPVAEETGMIVPIGVWSIEEACRCAREWCSLPVDGAPLHLSVNLSARQLAQSDLVPTIGRILNGAAIDPRYVEFGIEVTETMATRDIATSTRVLHALHALGIRLSIDDFGIGYSSLAYLSRLPADSLKVDRTFVRDIATSAVNRAIVRTVADLGHSLGMSVVAEGVETDEQRRILRGTGIDLIQGFLCAQPVPADALRRMLADGRRTLAATLPAANAQRLARGRLPPPRRRKRR